MKKYVALLLALVMVFALAACGNSGGSGSGGDAASGGNLTFATGGEAGTYYALGTVLANFVSEKTDTSVTAIVGNGSQANIEDMDAGAVQLAFSQSDVASYAYQGTNLFKDGGAVESFSVVAALYMEQVQIVNPVWRLPTENQVGRRPQGQDRFHRRCRLGRVLQRA